LQDACDLLDRRTDLQAHRHDGEVLAGSAHDVGHIAAWFLLPLVGDLGEPREQLVILLAAGCPYIGIGEPGIGDDLVRVDDRPAIRDVMDHVGDVLMEHADRQHHGLTARADTLDQVAGLGHRFRE
jgi:hypothetical protein